jgi:hypothetical protein
LWAASRFPQYAGIGASTSASVRDDNFIRKGQKTPNQVKNAAFIAPVRNMADVGKDQVASPFSGDAVWVL